MSDEEQKEEQPNPAEEHEARVVRSLRRGAALVGIPLTAALLVPWKIRYSETLFAWDIAEQRDHIGYLLFPLCGLLFLLAAFAPRWSYAARARVVVVAAASVFGIGLLLMHQPNIRELGRMWLYAPYILFVTPVFAVGAEMAMHMRPRSRALTIAALVGWIAMFGVYCTPMDADADFTSSMLGATMRELARGRGDSVLMAMLLLALWILSFAGVTQAMRRLGEDRDEAAAKRFRTSWLGYLLFPVPMVVVATLGMVGQLDDPDDLVEFFVPFAGAFGFMFGTSLGLCHLLVLASESRVVRANVKRAALALALSIGAIVLIRALTPDRRDAHVAELWWEMAETVSDALEGKPVDPRFLGGYAEFDLRSAPAAVDVPEGTTFEPELFAVSVAGLPRYAQAVALGPDTLRWAAGGEYAETHFELLRRASPVLVEAVERLADASAATGCLPGLDDADVEGMPVAARNLASGDAASICGNEHDRYYARFGGSSVAQGGLGDYLIVVRGSDGERRALRGTTHFDSGRLWIGNPVPVTP